MKRSSMVLLMGLTLLQWTYAQDQKKEKTKTGFWELSLGTELNRFQDLKSSSAILNGLTVPVVIKRGRVSENSISTAGIRISSATLKSPLNDVTEVSSSIFNLHFDYLKKQRSNSKIFDAWYLGGKAEIRRQNLENEKLGNNSVNSVFTASISIASRFEKPIRLFSKKASLSYTLSAALLSYTKEDNSFAFAAPQGALENGTFDTQNFENSLFKYGEIATVNKFNGLRSQLAIHFSPRKRSSWTIAYDWQLMKYTKVKNFGITSASHTLSIAYHLPKKKK